MIASVAPSARRVAAASPVRTALSAPVWVLTALVAVSAAVRGAVAWQHSVPRYFPDEYIYVSLARSIGHGHLQVHGHTAHFPALLEPILAAPLWRLFSVQTAYHLVQVENAFAASLVVVPVYLLARELRLSRGYAYLCCVYSVALPMLVASAFAVTDFVAYPLVLAAILTGVRGLTRPSWQRDLVFLGFAVLSTFARLEYFVLVPAYIVAAAIVDRRRMLRTHPLAVGAIVPAVVAALVGSLGFYNISQRSFEHSIATWIPLEAFLLAVVSGVVIVPGAVAGLIRPGDRARASFGAIASVFAFALIVEVSVFSAQEGRFRERYLFAILPLVALAFGVYLERRRPHRWVVLGVAVAIAIAAARLPLSAYATAARFYDSQTLIAAEQFQDRWTPGSSSLLLAFAITAGALGACLIALWPRLGRVALPIVIVVLVAASVAAANFDLERSHSGRRGLGKDLSWIDHASGGKPVTTVVPPSSAFLALLEQLFWNPAANHEVVMANASGSDPYATEPLRLEHDGTLANLDPYFLFDASGSRPSFTGATLVRRKGYYSVYRVDGTPRFHTLVTNLVYTGWLSPDGRIGAWAPAGKRARVKFTLALPAYLKNITEHIRLGDRVLTVRGGESVRVACESTTRRLDVGYSSRPVLTDNLGRSVVMEMHRIRPADAPAPGARPTTAIGRASCVPITG